MKKILFGATALAAVSTISTAYASDPIKLQLGGYLEYYAVGASQDSDYKKANRVNNFDMQGESEIWFSGVTTLDNGLSVGVRVELEGGSDHDGASDIIDESYLYVSGKFGKIELGSTDNIAYKMRAVAPNASYSEVDDDSIPRYLLRPFTDDNITDLGFDGDANKISYLTPKFYGIQFGVSYSPSNDAQGDDGVSASETIRKAANFDEAWAAGVSYEREIGAVGLLATAGYTVANGAGATDNGTTNGTAQDWAFGLNLTYQGFTLGGAYRGVSAKSNSGFSEYDGYGWDAGLMYSEGPYAVSLNYRQSITAGNAGIAGDNQIDTYAIGAKYTLGAGVDVFGQLAYADYDQEGTLQDNKGAYGGVVGIHLDF